MSEDMTAENTARRRSAAAYLLSCVLVCILGSYILGSTTSWMTDFRIVYYGSRCLLHHHDPYNSQESASSYRAEGGEFRVNQAEQHAFAEDAFRPIYLPQALIAVAPIAMLPWKVASAIWRLLAAAALAIAGYLVGRTGGRFAPALSTLLVCIVLANAEFLFVEGNAVGITVGLCVIAAWCFIEERFTLASVLCMALALTFKPQDAGLVWLYFLLVGGTQRKRALQALAVAAALAVPAALWMTHISPNWVQELHANVLTGAAHGKTNDPGPATFIRFNGVISLQSVISLIRDAPRFYNTISYTVCGLLLLAGAIKTLRTRFTRENAWLALAAISTLSMLPVYHRLYDAKLLLLAIPASAMLWAGGGKLKWPAALLTAATIMVTADIPSVILLLIAEKYHAHGTLATLALRRPFAPALLVIGVFYLVVYLRRAAPGLNAQNPTPKDAEAGL